jgi:hypothetical protein
MTTALSGLRHGETDRSVPKGSPACQSVAVQVEKLIVRRWTNHVTRLHACAASQTRPVEGKGEFPLVSLNNREIVGHWIKHSLTHAHLHQLARWAWPHLLPL